MNASTHAELTELIQRGVPEFDLSDKRRRILQIDASAQNDVEQVKRALDKLVNPGAVHFDLIASYLSEAIHKSGISHMQEASSAIDSLGDVDHEMRSVAEKQNEPNSERLQARARRIADTEF